MNWWYLGTILLCSVKIISGFRVKTQNPHILHRLRTQGVTTSMTELGILGGSIRTQAQERRQRRQFHPLYLSSVVDSAATSTVPSWTCLLSTNQDLDAAVAEVIEGINGSNDHNLAIFYVSSIYEASSFKYDTIFKQLKAKFPRIRVVIGKYYGSRNWTHIAF